MTEKAERYRAIAQIAELLRETTVKKPVYDFTKKEIVDFEYTNVVFDEQEHRDVKRAFLRLCGEI